MQAAAGGEPSPRGVKQSPHYHKPGAMLRKLLLGNSYSNDKGEKPVRNGSKGPSVPEHAQQGRAQAPAHPRQAGASTPLITTLPQEFTKPLTMNVCESFPK